MDLNTVQADLLTPEMSTLPPAAGRRVRQVLKRYAGTDVYHAVYLPVEWQSGRMYPVIFEYPGNQWTSPDGESGSGQLESCTLGFGISGGQDFIWVSLPFIGSDGRQQQRRWWGDVDATVAYCKEAVKCVCAEFGGDANALFLTGFSRGAVACNFIGLHDDECARLWRGFVAHSHYDGSEHWPECDPISARQRLQRLNGRPQFISHEGSVAHTERFIRESGIEGNFTFVSLPFTKHTAGWVLRDLPERRRLREWIRAVRKS